MCPRTCRSLHLETNPFLAAALSSWAKPSSPPQFHGWHSTDGVLQPWQASLLPGSYLSTSAPSFPPSFTRHLPVACRPGCDLTPYFPERIGLRGDTPTPLSPTPSFPSIITGLHLSTSSFCLGYKSPSPSGKPVLLFWLH